MLANGKPAFTNLTNPNEAKADLPAGTVSASVAAAGTTTPVIGPVDLTLPASTITVVYAVGSLDGKTLHPLVQTIPVSTTPAQTISSTSLGDASRLDWLPVWGARRDVARESWLSLGIARHPTTLT